MIKNKYEMKTCTVQYDKIKSKDRKPKAHTHASIIFGKGGNRRVHMSTCVRDGGTKNNRRWGRPLVFCV